MFLTHSRAMRLLKSEMPFFEHVESMLLCVKNNHTQGVEYNAKVVFAFARNLYIC
ncbi:hypothetical protein SAMN04487979_106160 [Flavobacterium sp. ov086]|nr:hypothetical protein SAMN04487979_106160 [Flavobacterium sp. ov086]